MKADQLRKKFIEFFISKGHKEIPPAPLVPIDDPTTLFTSSGMQPLVPYLLGQAHPLGKRLTDSQPSFRAEDIEEVGDNRHTTFFEMLGNWSLGDYFKKEQLPWFFEFLTKIVELDPERLYVSVFSGNDSIPKDKESIKIWQELFKTKSPSQRGEKGFDPKIKIYTYPAEKNWWSRAGVPDKMPTDEIGGPDSEVFFDFDPENKLKIHEKSEFKDKPCHINCDCGRFLEIGNSVFMQYKKKADGSLESLPNKNVDFGGGLERILAAKLDTPDVFKTDLFWPIIQEIEKASDKKYQGNEKEMRIIVDHLKAACFMINEGVEPSNKRQGYILRRLIRRAVVEMQKLNIIPRKILDKLCQQVIVIYKNSFLAEAQSYKIHPTIGKEADDFIPLLHRGTKILQTQKITSKLLFDLHQSQGLPFELSKELLSQWHKPISKELEKEVKEKIVKHQQLSRTASKGMFKGGLADHSEKITKLHSATHLLHAALRKILGDHVQQVGSNITTERLRFDFTHPKPLANQEIKQIEELVNQQIKKNLKVSFKTMTLAEAQKQGALAFFGQRYPEKVKVYSIEGFSKEVCGGPHVDFTGKLGKFKIKKEESCGSGKRRIYAVLV